MKTNDLIEIIEFFYPLKLAEKWDNVGLLIGDKNKEIKKVLTCLEITVDVIEEAQENQIDLIISHHPIIFKPISNLNYQNSNNQKIVQLIQSNISVYCAHTNLDVAYNGLNDWLCEFLEVNQQKVLKKTYTDYFHFMLVETKPGELNKIIELLTKLGIGQQFDTKQRFNIIKKKNIEIDNNKEIEKEILEIQCYVAEDQIKTLKYQSQILKKEENISLIFNTVKSSSLSLDFGIGRYGIVKPQSLEELASKIKELFALDHVKIVGSREKIIRKVAIVGGAGQDCIEEAINNNCDVLITGDTTFHDVHYAIENGLCIIDASHAIEIIFNDVMKDLLSLFNEVEIISSDIDVNPYEVI